MNMWIRHYHIISSWHTFSSLSVWLAMCAIVERKRIWEWRWRWIWCENGRKLHTTKNGQLISSGTRAETLSRISWSIICRNLFFLYSCGSPVLLFRLESKFQPKKRFNRYKPVHPLHIRRFQHQLTWFLLPTRLGERWWVNSWSFPWNEGWPFPNSVYMPYFPFSLSGQSVDRLHNENLCAN